MPFHPPDRFNIADHFLDDRIREGLGGRIALRTRDSTVSYAELQARANRFANVFAEMGVRPEERVLIGLPDVPDFPAALFGALKRGAVGVMVNCYLAEEPHPRPVRLHARQRRGGGCGARRSVHPRGPRRTPRPPPPRPRHR